MWWGGGKRRKILGISGRGRKGRHRATATAKALSQNSRGINPSPVTPCAIECLIPPPANKGTSERERERERGVNTLVSHKQVIQRMQERPGRVSVEFVGVGVGFECGVE